MAARKRKRLNKLAVAAIVVLGVLVVVGMGGILASAMGVNVGGYYHRCLDRIFPKDPVAYARRGDEAYEAGRYGLARREYMVAIGASQNPVYYFKLARVEVDWALKARDLRDAERRKHYADGVRYLRQAILLDGSYVEPQSLLCEILWAEPVNTRPWEQYIKEASRLLEMEPQDHKTHFRRAMAEAAMDRSVKGDHASKAMAGFEKAVQLEPKEVNYWLGMTQFLQAANQTDRAKQTFAKGLEVNPDSTELRVNYAEFLRAHDAKEEARKHLEEAIRRNPGHATGYLYLSGFYLAENVPDEAVKVLQQGEKSARGDFRVYRDLARIYARRKETARAAEELRKGLALAAERESASASQPSPGDQPAQEDAAWQLNYFLANVLLDLGESQRADRDKLLAEAKACLVEIRKRRPEGPQQAKLAGRIALAEGRVDEAVKLLEQAYALFGQNPEPQTATILINVYLAQNLPGKAERIVDQFLNIPGQRTNPTALLAKAKLLVRYRDYATASRYVSQALQREPDNPEARNLQLVLMTLTGESGKLSKDLAPSPQAVSLLLERSATMWINEQRPQALELTEQLLSRAPKDPAVISQLVSMYLALDQADKADALMRKVTADNPDNEALKFQLELIRERDPARRTSMRLAKAEEIKDEFDRALAKAAIFAMQGGEKEYLEQLNEAARVKPADPDVIERLFRHAVGRGNWPLAGQCIQRASQADLDGVGGRIYQAELAMAQNQFPQAIAVLGEALKEHGELKRARTMLGECYLRTNSLEQAEQAFRGVASDDPGYAPAVVGMAQVAERQGKLEDHAQWIEKAYRLVPQNPYVREQHLAIRAMQAGPEEIAKLIDQRERMLRQDASSPQLSNRLHLAALYERTARMDKAEEAYRFVYANSPNRLAAARLLVAHLMRTRQTGQAEEVLRDLLKNTSDRVGAYVLYGEVLAPYSVEQSAGMLGKALAADPKDPRGHLAMARLLAGQRNWKAAAEAMKRCVDLRPDDRAGEKDLVRYWIEAGQLEQASGRLESILSAAPGDAEALTLKGILLMRERSLGKAIEVLSRAAEENPEYPPPLVYRAQAWLARGEPDRAKDDLRKARQLSDDPETVMQLVSVYVRERDFANAQSELTDILRRRKDYVPAITRLIALYTLQEKWTLLEPLLGDARKTFPAEPSLLLAEAEMWSRRGERSKVAAAMEAAWKLTGNSPAIFQDYLQALLAGGEFDKVLSVSEGFVDKSLHDSRGEADYGAWVKAIRAHALVRQDKAAQADQVFAAALKEASPEQLGAVVLQISQAYGPAQATVKLQEWAKVRGDDWAVHAQVGDLHLAAARAGDASHLAQAEQALLKARRLASRSQDAAAVDNRLGVAYSAAGKLKEARRTYLGVLDVFPDNFQALNNLAYLYTNDMNEPSSALPYAQKIFELSRTDPNVLDTYGWTLANLKRFSEAEKHLLGSIEIGSPTPANCYHLGWVYENEPNPRLAEALKQYRRALQLVRDSTNDPLYPLLSQAVPRVEQKLSARSGR